MTNNIICNIDHKFGVHIRGPNHIVRTNIIDFDGPDLLPPFAVIGGSRRANVALARPPIWNHQYTCENNIVWSSSGSIFRISGPPDQETFTQVDNSVYFNPHGRNTFARIRGKDTLENWHSMGLDANTTLAEPLFVNREHHDYRLKPDSPALALKVRQIGTTEIGPKKDLPYKNRERLSTESGQK